MLIAIGALAVASFSGNGDNGGPAPYAITVAGCAIVAAVLFAHVLPGAAYPDRTSWILAALALITCVVFWTGLPIVLGMAAVYSGLRADPPRAGRARGRSRSCSASSPASSGSAPQKPRVSARKTTVATDGGVVHHGRRDVIPDALKGTARRGPHVPG